MENFGTLRNNSSLIVSTLSVNPSAIAGDLFEYLGSKRAALGLINSMPFNYSGRYTLEVKSIFEDAESISKSIIDSLNATVQVEIFAKGKKI